MESRRCHSLATSLLLLLLLFLVLLFRKDGGWLCGPAQHEQKQSE